MSVVMCDKMKRMLLVVSVNLYTKTSSHNVWVLRNCSVCGCGWRYCFVRYLHQDGRHLGWVNVMWLMYHLNRVNKWRPVMVMVMMTAWVTMIILMIVHFL